MGKYFKYMNPKNIQREVSAYGYEFSFQKHIVSLLIMMIGSAILGYILGMQPAYIAILIIACLIIMPMMTVSAYRQMYEQKRFEDVGSYLEQVLYSFKRRPKIVTSLEDTSKIFKEGSTMQGLLNKAIGIINSATLKGNVYKKALDEIEKPYFCRPIQMAHNFMRSVEQYGGEYDKSADILIDDRNRWVERVYDVQTDKKKLKMNMTISIVLSLIIVTVSSKMIPKNLIDINTSIIVQIMTTATLILDLILWAFVQLKLSGSWISYKEDKSIKRTYDSVMHPKPENKRKKYTTWFMLSILVGTVACVTRDIKPTGAMIIFACFVLYNPTRLKKVHRKWLAREVEKAFPDWMISVALLLQTDNVHVALSKSVEDAPFVLQEELERLLDGIEKNPTVIDPYLDFYSQIPMPEIQSSMKMLYSMSQFGAEEMGTQIESMISRNSVMQDKAEKMRSKDQLAGMGFFVFLPMLTGTLKMLVDMGTMLTGVMSKFGV